MADDGTFYLDELRADVRHVLVVREPGYGTVVYDFPDHELNGRLIELGTIVLEVGAVLAGRVLDENDRPIPHRDVSLRGHNGDRFRFGRANEQSSSVDSYACLLRDNDRIAEAEELENRFAAISFEPKK